MTSPGQDSQGAVPDARRILGDLAHLVAELQAIHAAFDLEIEIRRGSP